VTFTAEGEGGGSWYVVRSAGGWELEAAPVAGAAALSWQGDDELAFAMAGVKAVLG
jgi:hypothetical protein